MGINLPCGNTPLTTTECGGDCDEKIERLAERVSEAEDKLDTIQEGAEVNVNADWDETDPDSDAYIENKPSVNYDLSLGDSAPTVGSAVVGSAVLGTLVDIILGRGDGTEDRVSVSGTGAIQITRDGDTMTIHVPVGEIDQLRNGTDTEARAWAASVLKQWLDERIAQIPADQFLDLNKTVFANPFTWSSSTYPGSINPNLDGKPVLVLALTDGENVSYSFLNMEDLIDAYEGVAPISVNGSQISHDNSGVTAGSYGDASNQTPNFGDTFKALRSTVDAKGHVTSMSEHTVKIPDTLATQESAGLMSAEDKEKLDNVDQLYKTTCGNPIVIDDADGEVKALNVELAPIQAGTPTHDSTIYNEPYLSKTSPNFNSEYDKLVGGTIAWNQLLNIETMGAFIASTKSYDSDTGVVTVTPTNYASNSIGFYTTAAQLKTKANHVYFTSVDINPDYSGLFRFGVEGSAKSERLNAGLYQTLATVAKRNGEYAVTLYLASQDWTTGVYKYKNGKVIDLTQMFGSTIADYIYNLEQSTAGAGVAFFRKLFPKPYYAYNAGELISVKPTAHVTSETYSLAGVELRGIPKISNGALYYDGDEYESDGTVTRRYGVVDLGTLNWSSGTDSVNTVFFATIPNLKYVADASVVNAICTKFTAITKVAWSGASINVDKVFRSDNSASILYFRDLSYTDSTAFKTAMSGVYLVYELATPTTEEADPYQNPQEVGTTESYTDNRAVPIPVGHESTYANIYPITGYDNTIFTDSNGTDTTTTTVTLPHTVYGADVDVTGGESKETWQNIASYNGETISEPWLSSMDEYVQGTTPTTGAQVCYELATPTPLTTTPTALTLYKGDNVVSSDGDMCITYLQDRGDLTDLVNEVHNMHKEVQVTLDADEWTETGTQAVMISGLEPDDSVIVTPAPSDLITYVNAGVVCISQGTDSLTFQANTPVTVNVNILIAR